MGRILGMSDNLAEMFGALNDEDEVPALEEATARQLLADALAKLDERHDFVRGQMIRKKRGLSNGTHDMRGGVGIFLAYETPDFSKIDTVPLGVQAPIVRGADMLIGHIDDDGAMIEHYVQSEYYEPADPE